MTAPETIVLPKSGLVLTRNKSGDAWELAADKRFMIDFVTLTWGWGAPSIAQFPFDTADAAAADLDAHILELRAALLPADARERVAAALVPHVDHIGEFDYEAAIDAVLAALAGGGK